MAADQFLKTLFGIHSTGFVVLQRVATAQKFLHGLRRDVGLSCLRTV